MYIVQLICNLLVNKFVFHRFLTMLWKNGHPMNQHGCQLSVSQATRHYVTCLIWQRAWRYSFASWRIMSQDSPNHQKVKHHFCPFSHTVSEQSTRAWFSLATFTSCFHMFRCDEWKNNQNNLFFISAYIGSPKLGAKKKKQPKRT